MPLAPSITSSVGPPVYTRPHTYASLISLVNNGGVAAGTDAGATSEGSGQVVINFPEMPDLIELARSAVYNNTMQTQITPDGLHKYHHTDPLRIPVHFNLSAYDKTYCTDGPVALLNIAARLHALTLPVSPSSGTSGLAPARDASGDSVVNGKAEQDVAVGSAATGMFTVNGKGLYYPPACLLRITFVDTGSRQIGINCVGFVTDVSARLKGPWLQGPDGGTVQNLPTRAEYSFTFVHQPGYTNVFLNNPPTRSALAGDVYKRLYSTYDIIGNDPDVKTDAGRRFVGIFGS